MFLIAQLVLHALVEVLLTFSPVHYFKNLRAGGGGKYCFIMKSKAAKKRRYINLKNLKTDVDVYLNQLHI